MPRVGGKRRPGGLPSSSKTSRTCDRLRPVGLGTKVSVESLVIALFIATLMITFLLTFRLEEGSTAERVNWWIHMTVILAFMALIPASKHLHLVLSPITVFLKSKDGLTVPLEAKSSSRARSRCRLREASEAARLQGGHARAVTGRCARRAMRCT